MNGTAPMNMRTPINANAAKGVNTPNPSQQACRVAVAMAAGGIITTITHIL